MSIQQGPMTLRSVRSRRGGLSQVTPRGPFVPCLLYLLLLLTRVYNDEDDDDDKGRWRLSGREKPKLILLCFSPPHRYLLPSFHLPSLSTRSLRARGGLLIHRKVGQPGAAAPMKMNYDVGGPWLIPYWRRSHPSFRQLLHASSRLFLASCLRTRYRNYCISRLVVANGFSRYLLFCIRFVSLSYARNKTLFGNFQKAYLLNFLVNSLLKSYLR